MIYVFDGGTRTIALDGGGAHEQQFSVRDMYSRWKDWVKAGNAGCAKAFLSVGGDPISAGISIPAYIYITNGWLIVPDATVNANITVLDGILLKDGGGDPFKDPTGPGGLGWAHIMYQQPVQALTVGIGEPEPGFTMEEAMKLVLAALAGKLSGAPGGPIVIRDVNDTKDRITATVDANGNRTAVTVDPD